MFKKNYFIKCDDNTVRTRRFKRVYDGQVDPPTYFDRYIWPNYLKYKTHCEVNYQDIVIAVLTI